MMKAMRTSSNTSMAMKTSIKLKEANIVKRVQRKNMDSKIHHRGYRGITR